MFTLFNQRVIHQFVNKKEQIVSSNALNRMQAFITRYDCRFHLLPIPLVVDKQSYDELGQATKILMESQKKILAYLIASLSQKEILSYFDLPSEILPFINWKELINGENIIVRFDIVPSEYGFQFCEINAESSIGGLKLRDCYSEYLQALNFHDNLDYSPRQQIADFLYKKTQDNEYDQIVIFSMKAYLEEGTGTVRSLHECVANHVTHLPVILAHEQSYPEELLMPLKGIKTLVYRLAMYDDVNCHDLFLKLFSSGATVINSFASEIRSNKKWFAMFHDEKFQSILTKEERFTIEKYIPWTHYLTENNINQFLEQKNELVFKKNRAYGGSSVLVGQEHEQNILFNKLADLTHWTVQKLIECSDICLPVDDSFQIQSCKIVLGLFLINNQNSGMLIRASSKSRVVSVATEDAYIGWVLPASYVQRDKLLSNLDSLSESEHERIGSINL
jgi:hypothetical protein